MVSRTSHATGSLFDQLPRGTISVALGVALIGLAITFGTNTLEIYRLEREAAELTRTKQQLQEQQAILHEEIKALHTPAYILHPPPPPPVPVVAPAEHVSWGARLWAIVARIFRHDAARFH